MATVAELEADKAAVLAARLKFLKGEAVREVSRAGRKLVFHGMSLEDFSKAIAYLDQEILAAQAAADGGATRRRRALTVSYR